MSSPGLDEIVRRSMQFYRRTRSEKSSEKICQLFGSMMSSYDKGLSEIVGGKSDTFAIDLTEEQIDTLFENDNLSHILAAPPKPINCGMIIVLFFQDGIVFMSQELHHRTICRFTNDPNRFENLAEKI